MKKLLFAMLLVSGLSGSVFAFNATATLTADNHYGLFVGDENGDDLRLIGRNEVGLAGSPGMFAWSLPETYQFDVNPGEYLYVLAWDVGGPQAWIGNFFTPIGELASNKTEMGC